jgi:glutamate-1-semialdehyde 2,1-aminomutase
MKTDDTIQAQKTENSEALFARAVKALPGGVNSPVRAFRKVSGTPRFFDHGQGAHFTDVDGNRYLDFVMSFGPLILGHAHPEVIEAVSDSARRGTTFGAPHRDEVDLAERVNAAYPGCERVRFTSSGTEATMSAIRLARGAAGPDRPRLLKFEGCYHGHSDGLLVAAGSGAKTFGSPSSAGVPEDVAKWTSVLPLDDIDAVVQYFEEFGHETAAVICEPIPANDGLLVQSRKWLKTLVDSAHKAGALVIFDEVITGFRIGPGGAAALYGLTPDLCTFGKVVGGGLPVGAFGGRAELFEHLAPDGPVYQGGTLSGNPVAMAAGLKNLDVLERDQGWARIQALGRRLARGMRAAIEARPHAQVRFVRAGSLFWFALGSRQRPCSAAAMADHGPELFKTFHAACLERGVYLAPSAYEVGFLSVAHTEEDIDQAIRVFTEAMDVTFPASRATLHTLSDDFRP